MSKKGCIRIIIIGIVTLLLISFAIIYLFKKLLDESQTEITLVEAFQGRNHLLENENADYHSYLLIMPENVTKDMKIETYYFSEFQFFNNLYTVLLVYTLEDEAYKQEKERLSELQITYQEKKKDIIQMEQSNMKDSYIAIYGENGCYEYALTDDSHNRIVCVFTQYDGFENIPEVYQIKAIDLSKDEWESEDIAFNMYYFLLEDGIRIMPELNGETVKGANIPYK